MKPLSVVLGIVINNNQILLLKKIKYPFQGLLSFPGGKIEFGETPAQAAVREIEEESGIKTYFMKHIGVVSEQIVDNKEIKEHFLLHLCLLHPTTTIITNSCEGELRWYDLSNLDQIKTLMIPSDYEMLKQWLAAKETLYVNSVIEKQGDKYILKKFE